MGLYCKELYETTHFVSIVYYVERFQHRELDQKVTKTNFIEAPTFSIIQASLILLSLKRRIQDYVRLAQKIGTRRLKFSNSLVSRSNSENFLTPTSLIFWLTKRGRTLANNSIKILGRFADNHTIQFSPSGIHFFGSRFAETSKSKI